MIKHKVIGEGTYGCVHKPSLKCETTQQDINYDNKISKLLDKNEAADELKEFANISRIDPTNSFHDGPPISCIPSTTESNIKAAKKCKNTTIKNSIKHKAIPRYLKLLVMEDGGTDLRKFVNSMMKKNITPKNTKIIEQFFIEFERMFYALKKLEDSSFIHNDLKLDNIVYNKDKNRINFIDFGISSDYKTIIDKGKNNEYYIGRTCHWSFPPEVIFINRDKRKDARNRVNNDNSYTAEGDLFINKFFFNQGYGWASLAVSNIYPTFSGQEIRDALKKKSADLRSSYDFIKNINKKKDFYLPSIFTIDSYGVGMALSFCAYSLKKFISNELFHQITALTEIMTHWDISKRKDCAYLLSNYQDILSNNGLLIKYNFKIQPHNDGYNTIIPNPTTKLPKPPAIKLPVKKVRRDVVPPSPIFIETDTKTKTPIIPPPPPNTPVTTKNKTKNKSKSKSKSKTRKADTYSTDKWRKQHLRDRLSSIRKTPKGTKYVKGIGVSNQNKPQLIKEIRRLENEKGLEPKSLSNYK
jgi:serine/threonine protein kinase